MASRKNDMQHSTAAIGRTSYRFGIFISTISAFLGRGLTLVTGIILAKTLLPEVLGKFSGDQALVYIGAGLINLGIGHGYRQIVSRNPALRYSYFLPALFVRILAMMLYFGGLTTYLKWTGLWNSQTVAVVLAVVMFHMLDLFRIDLQIVRCYIKAGFMNLGAGLVLLFSAIVCWQTGANYNFLVYPYLILTCLLVVVGWILVNPKISSIVRFDYRVLIKTSIPFAAAIFVYSFTTYWGLTYIRVVLGEEQAGYYFLPLKVYQIGLVAGMSINGVTLPLYHRLAVSKQLETFADVFSRLIRGMWLVSGIIVAVCCFIPEFILSTFATEKYMAAVPVFPWIGFGILFRLLAMPAGNTLESVDKQWYRVAVQAVGAIICMLGVIFLVPVKGIIGAAWTLFAVDLWILLAYWFVGHHFVPAVVSLPKLLCPCMALVVTLLFVSCCLHISAWLKLVVFCGIWAAYVLIVLNFKEEVSRILRVALKRD